MLITCWVGEAWKHVFEKQNPRTYFERTGCLLTIDGSEDDKVTIKGTKYTVKPTKEIDPTLAALVQPQSEEESNGSSTDEPQVPDPTFHADASDEFSILENNRVSENQDEEEVFMNM